MPGTTSALSGMFSYVTHIVIVISIVQINVALALLPVTSSPGHGQPLCIISWVSVAVVLIVFDC